MPSIDEQIRLQNPWWVRPEDVQIEPELRLYERSPLRWDPPALSAIPLAPGHIHTLRGPRQVGKTTTAKRLIERLVERGEKGVLYYSFDLHTDFSAIPDVISAAKRMRRNIGGPWFLFLDEISTVPEWQRGIKYAWDRGIIQEDFVLLTGSSAHDVKRGAEQLPGRRGAGSDFLQLPLSFRDFCQAAEGLRLPDETLMVHQMLTDRGRAVVSELMLQFEPLTAAFSTYSTIGGFPAAVAEYLRAKSASAELMANPAIIRLFWSTIAGDVARSGRDAVAALKLLEEVCLNLGNPLKWTGVANAMGVASHTTAKEYVEELAEAFLLLMVYHWSLSGGGLEPRRQRKVYFMDPLLSLIAPALNDGVRHAPADGMVENLVAIGLFRSAAQTLVQADAVPGTIAYWRSANDRELDFVVPAQRTSGHARFPVEVKGDAQAQISAAVRSIRAAFGQGIVVTRTRFDDDVTVPRIPAPVFLAALSENVRRENPLV